MKPLRTVAVGRRELDAGIALLGRFTDQRITLTEAGGLHVVEARKIRSCWSTDRQPGITGVPLVIDKRRAVHDRRVERLQAAGRQG